MSDPVNVESLNRRSEGKLPGMVEVEITVLDGGTLKSRLPLTEELLAPNGYLHAAAVIALADTSCGYGCFADMPDGAEGFTTVELKSNFTGTALSGAVACEARLAHGGRTTQVWDATVTDEGSGREICLFRCTQMILYG